MRVYLAGPMRGIDSWNFPAFDRAKKFLSERYGWVVVSPADIDRSLGLDEHDYPTLPPWFTIEHAMERDLQAVETCDAICLLAGWDDSEGSHIELHHALDNNLLVFMQKGVDVVQLSRAEGEALRTDNIVSFRSSGEVRVVDTDTGAEKGQKLARFDLVPTGPLWQLAEHYGRGASKYAPRNWERGTVWSLNYAAMLRHIFQWWAGEDMDPETGSHHLIAAVWHCFALVEFTDTHAEKDDRPIPSPTGP